MELHQLEEKYNALEARFDAELEKARHTKFTSVLVVMTSLLFLWVGSWF